MGWATCFAALCVSGPALAQSPTPPAEANPVGVYATKIRVSDLERAKKFYAILGLTGRQSLHGPSWDLRSEDPSRSHVILVPDGDGNPPMFGAFLLISVRSVKETAERLRQAGFAIPVAIRTIASGSVLMLKDPDGNVIEMVGPTSK